jgi:hypothetical protein
MKEGTLRCIECNHELIKHKEPSLISPLYHCPNFKCTRNGLVTMIMRYEGTREDEDRLV